MFSKLYLCLILFLLPMVLAAQTQPKSTQNNAPSSIDYKQTGAPMPPLFFMAFRDTAADVEGTVKKKKDRKQKQSTLDTDVMALYYPVSDKDLDNGANLFVMMFNPTCSHCEDVTDMMSKNIDLFKRTKVVLLANKLMLPYIPDFAQRHHTARYEPMYVGYDSSGFIENLFLYQTLPQINIYGADRKLLKSYCGEVSIDTLKKFIQ
ncbi:MAG: hypothetical protein K9G49_11140 [Taibaiella sp.]|nr:hypothetical protein [Taibaiella sp.]